LQIELDNLDIEVKDYIGNIYLKGEYNMEKDENEIAETI
jgi:hypothetical protein